MKGEDKALEDYLVAVLRLVELYGIARTSDVAKILNVRPSTVTKVLQRLAREGYLVWEPYKGFKLSPKGLEIAKRVIWRHRVAEVFLHDVLGFDIVYCHKLAHRLEHLPDEFFDRLYRYLGKPRQCPHGNPIPDPSATGIKVVSDRPLASLEPGSLCIVSRVLCFVSEELMERVKELGIGIGLEIRVTSKTSNGIEISVSGKRLVVDYDTARIIRCVERR